MISVNRHAAPIPKIVFESLVSAVTRNPPAALFPWQNLIYSAGINHPLKASAQIIQQVHAQIDMALTLVANNFKWLVAGLV